MTRSIGPGLRRTDRVTLMNVRLGIALAAILTAAACAASHAAANDPSAHFDAGSKAFSSGDYAAAAAAFEAARAAGMSGPAVEYNAGVSYYRLGDYSRAEDSFRDLARSYPEMTPLAEYNLGLALLKQDRFGEARAAFERASAGDDATIAALAAAMLERADLRGEPARAAQWVRLIDFAVGYDDNVALLEEASLPAGPSTESRLAEFFGLVSGRFGKRNAVRLDASAYVVRYADAPDFDQDAFRLGFAYLWQAGSWRIDAGSYYDYGVLAGRGFERRLGATLTAHYPLGEAMLMSLRYVHDDVANVSNEFSFVDGTRDRLSVGFEQRIERGKLALGYVRERNDRAGASVSPDRHEIFAGYEHTLSAEWSVEVRGLLRLSRYGRLDEPRDEDLSQLRVSATRDFVSGWQLLGEYRIADNSSSVDVFSYDRNRLTLSLNRLF